MGWTYSVAVFLIAGVSMPSIPAKQWIDDYDRAVADARRSGRPLVIVLESDDARNVELFRVSSLPESPLRHCSVCRLDAESDEGRKIADGYGVSQFPYTLITDPDCKNIVFRGAGTFTEESWQRTLTEFSIPEELSPAEPLEPATVEEPDHREKTPQQNVSAAFSETDRELVLQRAHQEGRYLVAFITMKGCRFCEVMKKQTLGHPDVQSVVSKNFASVTIHREEESSWVDEQMIEIYPTTLIFDAAGIEVGRMEGNVAVERFLGNLGRWHAPVVSLMW